MILKLKIKDPKNLINWIEKFKTFQSSLLIEISNDGILSRVCNEDRAYIKYSKIDFESLDVEVDVSELVEIKKIYFGVYDIKKFINMLKYFNSSIEMAIHYEKIYDKEHGEVYVAEQVVLQDNFAKIGMRCVSISGFVIIQEERFNAIKQINNVPIFTVKKETFDNISQLIELEKSSDTRITISYDKSNIVFSGENFELKEYHDTKMEKNEYGSIVIINDRLNKLDKENYLVYMTSDVIVFDSKDTETTLLVARCI